MHDNLFTMQNIRLDSILLIDIETVPQYASFNDMDDNWKTLWEEKTLRSLPEATTPSEFYPQRAGVMAEFSKIVCISVGYFKKENDAYQLRIKSFYGDDEKQLLKDFLVLLQQAEANSNRWSFTGHNIKEFDIPFICRRLIVHSLHIPPALDFQNMKPWETNIIDTFQYWRFGDYKHYTSLKLLAATLGIPSPKDDIDGSMVGEVYWKENNIERIVTYCQKDIVTTGNIVLRFKNMPLLATGDVLIIK